MKSGVAGARRVLVTIVGVAVLAVGVAGLALPGPGVLIIALGFGILATEYTWARSLFERTRAKAMETAEAAARSRLQTTGTVLLGVGMLAVGVFLSVVDSFVVFGFEFARLTIGVSIALGGVLVLATLIYALRAVRTGRSRRSDEETVQPNR